MNPAKQAETGEAFSLLSLHDVQKVVYMEVFTTTTHLQRSTGVEQTMKCKMFGFNIVLIFIKFQSQYILFNSSKLQKFYNLPICCHVWFGSLWILAGYSKDFHLHQDLFSSTGWLGCVWISFNMSTKAIDIWYLKIVSKMRRGCCWFVEELMCPFSGGTHINFHGPHYPL